MKPVIRQRNCMWQVISVVIACNLDLHQVASLALSWIEDRRACVTKSRERGRITFPSKESKRWTEEMILALGGQFKQLSYMHPKKFRWFQWDSNPWPLRCRCSALTSWVMKSLSWELVNLLGWCVPVKGMNEWKTLFVKCGLKQKVSLSFWRVLLM